METIYAVVEDGVVTNLAVWDGESDWEPETGIAVKVESPCGIGWGYDGENFVAPEQDPDPANATF